MLFCGATPARVGSAARFQGHPRACGKCYPPLFLPCVRLPAAMRGSFPVIRYMQENETKTAKSEKRVRGLPKRGVFRRPERDLRAETGGNRGQKRPGKEERGPEMAKKGKKPGRRSEERPETCSESVQTMWDTSKRKKKAPDLWQKERGLRSVQPTRPRGRKRYEKKTPDRMQLKSICPLYICKKMNRNPQNPENPPKKEAPHIAGASFLGTAIHKPCKREVGQAFEDAAPYCAVHTIYARKRNRKVTSV